VRNRIAFHYLHVGFRSIVVLAESFVLIILWKLDKVLLILLKNESIWYE